MISEVGEGHYANLDTDACNLDMSGFSWNKETDDSALGKLKCRRIVNRMAVIIDP